jgi:hypothetical protein
MAITPNLLENESVCRKFGSAILHGAADLSVIPGLLKRILAEGMWREREVKPLHTVVRFDRFEDFVTTSPLEGIGATMEVVRGLIRHDVNACNLLDEAMQNRSGKPLTCNIVTDKAPAGNSRDKALRRLRKDRPDLLERVTEGELSAHAAMVQAGFRKVPTAYELLVRAWEKATEQERQEFATFMIKAGVFQDIIAP